MPELRRRSPPPHRHLGRPHSKISLPKMPPISRITSPENPRGNGLHQHDHVLQKVNRRILLPRSRRTGLSRQSSQTTVSQAAIRNTRKLFQSGQAAQGRDTQARPDKSRDAQVYCGQCYWALVSYENGLTGCCVGELVIWEE